MRKLIYIMAVITATLTSCGDTENEYANYPCNFFYDNAKNHSIKLAEASNALSPGIFCRISVSGKTFLFETNTDPGNTERKNFTAEDERRSIILGAYNESGIIVGYGNLDNPAVFYAYDSQCPNCYKETNMPRYTLQTDSKGMARCNRCKREYNMNNGGIVASGNGGDKMIRYRATTTGPQGIISVTSR